jgi:hypothetical protein
MKHSDLVEKTDAELVAMLDSALRDEQAFDPLLLFAELGRRRSDRLTRAAFWLTCANAALALVAVLVSVAALLTS